MSVTRLTLGKAREGEEGSRVYAAQINHPVSSAGQSSPKKKMAPSSKDFEGLADVTAYKMLPPEQGVERIEWRMTEHSVPSTLNDGS